MDLIKVAEQAFAAENPVEHPSFNTGVLPSGFQPREGTAPCLR